MNPSAPKEERYYEEIKNIPKLKTVLQVVFVLLFLTKFSLLKYTLTVIPACIYRTTWKIII